MSRSKIRKKPGQWRAFLALTYYSFRAQTRNPATFFFGFIFPVVFISIFGLIGGNVQKMKLGLADTSDTGNAVVETLKKQSFITLETGKKSDLEKKVIQGKIVGIIEVTKEDKGYTVSLLQSSAFPQESATVRSLITSTVDKTNLQISGITDPPVKLKEEEISGRKPRYIDYAVPGQIGFALLSTAIFGTVFGFIYLKKALVLKRMFATPTKALTILIAQGTSRLIIALAQTIIILLMAILVFQFYLPHGLQTFVELIIISVLGLIAFLGFGFFIAGLSNDENAASTLSNLITLPQFLLSGTFFSTETFPLWLQPVANNLPLSYFNLAVRHVTTEGGTILETWGYLLGLLAWGAVMYILAARTFKWQ